MPGLALAAGVAGVSWVMAALQLRWLGRVGVEALVIAILLGMTIRARWPLPALVAPGVSFAAKELLEVAVLLLGASVDLPLLLRAGPSLAIGIVLLVGLGLAGSYVVGRAFQLPPNLAILIACGNAICGNSAIAAVAPVIEAAPEHVASSIAFTAILGIGVVLGLPLLAGPLGLSDYQYGVFAGLTVYAVPQVLAAAFPVSVLSGQVATLVKLVRVLMLGPVVVFFALRQQGRTRRTREIADGTTAPANRTRLAQLVPPFILGFLTLAALRSAGAIPPSLAEIAHAASGWLTVLAMSALGLSVDVRVLARVGRSVIATVVVSMLMLGVLSITLIRLLAIR